MATLLMAILVEASIIFPLICENEIAGILTARTIFSKVEFMMLRF